MNHTKIQLSHSFDEIISLENLLLAWREFVGGKQNKKDVQEFSLRLMDNLILLHNDLANGDYQHGGYQAFKISDPKPRDIHKASVRDRLVHHAVYRILYPFFDRLFIADSYSCRNGKGTHKAINRFARFAYKAGRNNARTAWVLKCDIRKFFASIDQRILMEILAGHISDKRIILLLEKIIKSFDTGNCIVDSRLRGNDNKVGLPLGNLTSQLFANIYLNELDQFAKHRLKIKYYIRYADDFAIFSAGRDYLADLIPLIGNFLTAKLQLTLHPDKVFIKTINSGVDFLGWVNFFDHRVLRTKTKRRALRKIGTNPNRATVDSYLGLLKHGNAFKIRKEIFEILAKRT